MIFSCYTLKETFIQDEFKPEKAFHSYIHGTKFLIGHVGSLVAVIAFGKAETTFFFVFVLMKLHFKHFCVNFSQADFRDDAIDVTTERDHRQTGLNTKIAKFQTGNVRPAEAIFNTVDSRYLEIEGTIINTSRYPYFDISDL